MLLNGRDNLGGFCDIIIGGSVAEWLKAHDSKSCGVARLSKVRILSLPPRFQKPYRTDSFFESNPFASATVPEAVSYGFVLRIESFRSRHFLCKEKPPGDGRFSIKRNKHFRGSSRPTHNLFPERLLSLGAFLTTFCRRLDGYARR